MERHLNNWSDKGKRGIVGHHHGNELQRSQMKKKLKTNAKM